MRKRKARPIVVHFGDSLSESAIALPQKGGGIYAWGRSFGMNLSPQQEGNKLFGAWWVKTLLTDEHVALATQWDERVKPW